MEFLNNPIVKMVLTALAAANGALLIYPGVSPTVIAVCTVINAVFIALGVGVNAVQGKALRAAKAQVAELHAENIQLRGGK